MENLLIARKRKKLTQAALSGKVGCSEVMIGNIERGQNFPSVPLLLRLAIVLEVSTDFLLGREDKK